MRRPQPDVDSFTATDARTRIRAEVELDPTTPIVVALVDCVRAHVVKRGGHIASAVTIVHVNQGIHSVSTPRVTWSLLFQVGIERFSGPTVVDSETEGAFVLGVAVVSHATGANGSDGITGFARLRAAADTLLATWTTAVLATVRLSIAAVADAVTTPGSTHALVTTALVLAIVTAATSTIGGRVVAGFAFARLTFTVAKSGAVAISIVAGAEAPTAADTVSGDVVSGEAPV